MNSHRHHTRAVLLTAVVLLTGSDLVSFSAPSATDLAARVTIRRDRFGIPHILADTEEAAAFGDVVRPARPSDSAARAAATTRPP